jgi:hypothetical protein
MSWIEMELDAAREERIATLARDKYGRDTYNRRR